MILSMGLTGYGKVSIYCTHCCEYYFGEPEGVYHPKFDDVGKQLTTLSRRISADSNFLELLKTCPHAGNSYGPTEAVLVGRKI